MFTTGMLFIPASRMVRSTRQRILVGGLIALAFVYVWAELAVGIFTNLGS